MLYIFNQIINNDINYKPIDTMYGYYNQQLTSLQKLLICRDVYWYLNNNWTPDWTTQDYKYSIINSKNEIVPIENYYNQSVLAFPTPECRAHFINNFNYLIKECKYII